MSFPLKVVGDTIFLSSDLNLLELTIFLKERKVVRFAVVVT
jgi:hypothetical protein